MKINTINPQIASNGFWAPLLVVLFSGLYLGNDYISFFKESFSQVPDKTMTFLLLWGYLWGSIPGGILSSKIYKLGDLRQIGSGNIGATNVLRTGNKKAAILTLLIDAFKGIIAMGIAAYFLHYSCASPHLYCIAAAAVFGHIFPCWLNFKGGKGIATIAGITLALTWKIGAVLACLWITIARLTGISSLAAVVVVTLAPFLSWLLNEPWMILWFTVVSPLILYKHKDNIHRLLQGKESRFGVRS